MPDDDQDAIRDKARRYFEQYPSEIAMLARAIHLPFTHCVTWVNDTRDFSASEVLKIAAWVDDARNGALRDRVTVYRDTHDHWLPELARATHVSGALFREWLDNKQPLTDAQLERLDEWLKQVPEKDGGPY